MDLNIDKIDDICTFHLPSGKYFTNEQINFLKNKYNGIMCDNNKNCKDLLIKFNNITNNYINN